MDADDFRVEKARKPRVADVAQGSLFRLPHAPSVPVDTSEAAADYQEQKGDLPDIRFRMLRVINAAKRGMTDAELADFLDLYGDTARARRWDLEQQGLVRRDDSCTREYQDKREPRRKHRAAHPYVATVKGDACLRGLTPWPWAPARKK